MVNNWATFVFCEKLFVKNTIKKGFQQIFQNEKKKGGPQNFNGQ